NLDGANLEGADLTDARLPSAQLIDAKLGVATLENASFANADLRNAYLGGANLTSADFQNAILESANFEEALLTGANLRDAVLRRATLPGADLSGAKLERAILEGADLSQVSLQDADCRYAKFQGARLKGARFNRTRLYGSDFSVEVADGAQVDEVDFSAAGDGSQLIPLSGLAAFLNGKTDGGTASPQAAVAVAPAPTNRRYFGHGDVLRDASLEFDADSIVEVDGRFLKCNITLGQGAQLIIGREGLLDGCQVHGSGVLVVHGRFTSEAAPGIDGARRIIVGSTGSVRATVKQPAGHTHFAFEPGCVLRLKTERA
ncbi:MAG: pentapeptide repeat-containing protein, partial [Chloracidobacterium sp.]